MGIRSFVAVILPHTILTLYLPTYCHIIFIITVTVKYGFLIFTQKYIFIGWSFLLDLCSTKGINGLGSEVFIYYC